MRNVRENVLFSLDRNGLNEKDVDVIALCAQLELMQENLERIRRNDAFYRYEPIFSHANLRAAKNS